MVGRIPKFALILGVGLVFLGGIFLLQGWAEERQPIQFSHKRHTGGEETCKLCHEFYQRGAVAGRPSVETCLMCHAASISENPEEGKVREYAEREGDIPWRRVYKLSDHVYFSHRRHVALGELRCKDCHGDIGVSIKPPSRPAFPVTMDWCITCHRGAQVSNDCIACHK